MQFNLNEFLDALALAKCAEMGWFHEWRHRRSIPSAIDIFAAVMRSLLFLFDENFWSKPKPAVFDTTKLGKNSKQNNNKKQAENVVTTTKK